MTKVILSPTGNIRGNPSSAQSGINSNNQIVSDAFENTLSRDGTQPNQMLADFDLNHNDLLNAETIDTQTLLIRGRPVSFAGDLINAAAVNVSEKLFMGDGSTHSFDLELQHPSSDSLTLVWVGGSIQDTDQYNIVGASLEILDAPLDGVAVRALTFTGVSYNDVLDLADQTSENAADAAQSAQDAADAAASVSGLISEYNSISIAQTTEIPLAYDYVRTKFYDPDILDSKSFTGGAVYRRSSVSEVSTFPTSSWFNSSDGAYWLLADSRLTPCMFGAKGDGVTDDLVPFQAAIDYLTESNASVSGKLEAFCELDLIDRQYVISNQLIIRGTAQRDCLLKIKNGGIKVSSSFPAQANATLSPRPAVVLKNGGYGVRLENVFIDCNKKSSGLCLVPDSQQSRHTLVRNCHVVRFVNPLLLTESSIDLGTERPSNPQYNLLRPYGIRIGTEDTLVDDLASSMETLENNFVAQFEVTDDENAVWEKVNGIGIMCYAIDSKIRHNVVDTVRKGIVVCGWHNEISFNHPSPPNPRIHGDGINHGSDHISCIEIVQYGNNRIIGNYVDNGYITLYQENQILIGNYMTKSPDSTFGNTAGICFVAQEVNQDFVKNFVITDNKIMETLSFLVRYYEPGSFSFVNKVGQTSVAETAKISLEQQGIVRLDSAKSPLRISSAGGRSYLEYYHTTDHVASVYSGAYSDSGVEKFMVNIDENDVFSISPTQIDGFGSELIGVRKRLANYNVDTDVTVTHSNRVIVANTASPVVFTLTKAAPVGTSVKFVRRGSGSVTLHVQTGAMINGATTDIVLTRYEGCTATVYWNSDNFSAEWTLEGTF